MPKNQQKNTFFRCFFSAVLGAAQYLDIILVTAASGGVRCRLSKDKLYQLPYRSAFLSYNSYTKLFLLWAEYQAIKQAIGTAYKAANLLFFANFCGCPVLIVYNDRMGSYSDKSEVSTVSP